MSETATLLNKLPPVAKKTPSETESSVSSTDFGSKETLLVELRSQTSEAYTTSVLESEPLEDDVTSAIASISDAVVEAEQLIDVVIEETDEAELVTATVVSPEPIVETVPEAESGSPMMMIIFIVLPLLIVIAVIIVSAKGKSATSQKSILAEAKAAPKPTPVVSKPAAPQPKSTAVAQSKPAAKLPPKAAAKAPKSTAKKKPMQAPPPSKPSSTTTADYDAPAPNAPKQIKAPAKPTKRF